MVLVQLLLPVQSGASLMQRDAFDRVACELGERFGGVTLYARAPATGLWQEGSGGTARDDIVVCEVMTDPLDREWWRQYRVTLEQRFEQKEIVVRALCISRL